MSLKNRHGQYWDVLTRAATSKVLRRRAGSQWTSRHPRGDHSVPFLHPRQVLRTGKLGKQRLSKLVDDDIANILRLGW